VSMMSLGVGRFTFPFICGVFSWWESLLRLERCELLLFLEREVVWASESSLISEDLFFFL
jgi:hypothetical protein